MCFAAVSAADIWKAAPGWDRRAGPYDTDGGWVTVDQDAKSLGDD